MPTVFDSSIACVDDKGSSVDGDSSNKSTEASLACTELEVDTSAEGSNNP